MRAVVVRNTSNRRITRRGSRAFRRGATLVETVLAAIAVMACFVYPLSLAMRGTGGRIAQESERVHGAVLQQAR